MEVFVFSLSAGQGSSKSSSLRPDEWSRGVVLEEVLPEETPPALLPPLCSGAGLTGRCLYFLAVSGPVRVSMTTSLVQVPPTEAPWWTMCTRYTFSRQRWFHCDLVFITHQQRCVMRTVNWTRCQKACEQKLGTGTFFFTPSCSAVRMFRTFRQTLLPPVQTRDICCTTGERSLWINNVSGQTVHIHIQTVCCILLVTSVTFMINVYFLFLMSHYSFTNIRLLCDDVPWIMSHFVVLNVHGLLTINVFNDKMYK